MTSEPHETGLTGPATIVIKPHGPYLIQGDIEIRDPEGVLLTPPATKGPGTVKLCGCGLSRSRPFCDGSHNQTRD